MTRRTHARLAHPLSLALLATCASAAGKVWVLAPSAGPGVDFTDGFAAAAAVAEGDVILVRPGNYAAPQLTKNVVWVADAGATAQPVVLLSNGTFFPPHGWTVLRGFTLASFVHESIHSSAWIEDAHFAPPAAAFPAVAPAAELSLAGPACVGIRLALAHDALPGSTFGIVASAEQLHLYDVALYGKHGFHASPPYSEYPAGANALNIVGGGSAYVTNALIQGGEGAAGTSSSTTCTNGGNGGAALGFITSGSGTCEYVLRAVTLLAGLPGLAAPSGMCGGGSPGQLVAPGSTPITDLGPQSWDFAASTPVREGQALDVSYHGHAGELAFLLYSPRANPAYCASCQSSLLVDPTAVQVQFLQVLGASGAGQRSYSIQDLGSAVDAVSVFTQGAFLTTQGEIRLGPGSFVLLLDQAF